MGGRRSWRARERGQSESFEALHDGVPSWLWSSLWDWFKESVAVIADHFAGARAAEIVRLLERGIRTDLTSEAVASHGIYELRPLFSQDPDLFLDSVNELLILLQDPWARTQVGSLEFVLEHAGSLWRVDTSGDVPRLVRRVNETLQEMADQAMTGSGKPSAHLRTAWGALYGRDPDSTGAYREAVRAIEAAAHSVVVPTDANATLGKIIAALRAKPEKWTTSLSHPEGQRAQILNVAAMMEAVWKGQHDRHGSSSHEQPLHVSSEEAAAALAITLALVQLFESGAVTLASLHE